MKKFLSLLFALAISFSAMAQTPHVITTVDNVTPTTVTLTFVMNEYCTSYSYLLIESEMVAFYTQMMQCGVADLVVMWGIEEFVDVTYTFTSQIPGTDYIVYVLAHGNSGDELLETPVTTPSGGGDGTSEISIQVTEISDTSARVICIPNEETSVFRDMLITCDYFNEIGLDSAITMVKEDPYLHYETDDWNWLTLTAATDYYVLAIGQNANGVWGNLAQYQFSTLGGTAVKVLNNNVTVYPNPASDVVMLTNLPLGGVLKLSDLQGRVILE